MNHRLLVRRALSLLRRLISHFSATMKVLYFRAAFPEIRLPFTTTLARGVTLSATDNGTISIGESVFFGPNAQVIARGGRVVIGDDVHIGSGSIIVSQDSISIGSNTQIAEYVVIRDQDHDHSSRPIRTSGFRTGAIAVGNDCWLGCKSTVLRNSSIGDGCIIGAHSLISGDVPPFMLAVGCPHRVVRELPRE